MKINKCKCGGTAVCEQRHNDWVLYCAKFECCRLVRERTKKLAVEMWNLCNPAPKRKVKK